MTSAMRIGVAAVLTAAGFITGAARVDAQDLSWSSAVEIGGDEVYVLFTEPSLLFGPEEGLRPLVSLGAYYIILDGENSWGLTPAAGLRWQTDGGFISGKVGWAIRPDEAGADVFGGGDSGLHTSGHVEYWGDGTWGLQGIASYNWGAEFLWSRARGTRRVAEHASGASTALGAEFLWLDGATYQATYLGPVIQHIRPGGAVWAVSGGLKGVETTPDDNTWYLKVELSLP